MLQGKTKKYTFSFALFCNSKAKEKGRFLRLAQRTLRSFATHACNFAIMLGVLEKKCVAPLIRGERNCRAYPIKGIEKARVATERNGTKQGGEMELLTK